MIVIKKAKAAWSEQRSCWRLDIQYLDMEGAAKRTFIVVPGADASKSRGEAEAKRAAKDFSKCVGTLYGAFVSKYDGKRPAPEPKPERSPMRNRKGQTPTVAWLLGECFKHPEVWAKVKHSKNYHSGARKLNAIIGDRMISEFEPPHGRKLVLEVISKLRADGNSDGYVRKIAYQLRQALNAAIGQGVTDLIGDPVTGEALINDIPTFPHLPKAEPRKAVLEREHDKIVFEIIRARFAQAREEERAYAKKHNKEHELGVGAVGRVEIGANVVWLNSRRFSSTNWLTFESYIRFLLETGCRRGEALSMGNHSVRTRELIGDDGSLLETYEVLHVPAEVSKNGIERFINISPAVAEGMKLWQAYAKPHSFKIGDRTVSRDKAWFALAPNQVTNMWQHIRDDAKKTYAVDLSKVSPHQLRHTHATRMSERGMSGKPLSDSLGHTDERQTRTYDHAQSHHHSRKFFKRSVSQ